MFYLPVVLFELTRMNESVLLFLFAVLMEIWDKERKDNRAHGKGKLTRVIGDVFEGNWKDGVKHGKGVSMGKYAIRTGNGKKV